MILKSLSLTLAFCFLSFFSFLSLNHFSSIKKQERQDSKKQELKQELKKKLFYEHIGHRQEKLRVKQEKIKDLSSRYTLALADFSSLDLAEKFMDQLSQKGIRSYYKTMKNKNKLSYQIRKGFFNSLKAARKDKNTLEAKEVGAKIIKF